MKDLLTLPGVELGRLLKKKEISPVELLQQHILRTEEINGQLNAIVVKRFEQAQLRAEEAEKEILKGIDLGPFHGVPFTCKEVIANAGVPHSLGAQHRLNIIPEKDATALTRMKQGGAILIGITNVPEMGFWIECNNLIYGRTNNPHDLKRTSGGSSGGEGAIIAAGGSPIGLGSDAGGSIRIPSLYCGIFGHKPSSRTVPLTGHLPLTADKGAYPFFTSLHHHTSIGPMARSAQDLRPMLDIISGPDQIDYMVYKKKLGPKQFDWKQVKVVVCPNPKINLANKVGLSMQTAIHQAAAVLNDLGCQLEELDGSLFKHAMGIWEAIFKQAGDENLNSLFGLQAGSGLLKELALKTTGQGHYTMPGLVACVSERAKPMPAWQMAQLQSEANLLKNRLKRKLGPNGILLIPPFTSPAVKHNHTFRQPFDFAYCGIFNALGLPATSVPMGKENGLPLGIQIVANHHNDALTIAAAEVLEAETDGWQIALSTKQNG